MRYIPTPDARVEQLRKQAKKLQRKQGGKHTDLLDRVAKQANYDHWHHVVECNGRGKAATEMATLKAECEAIIDAELRGQVKVIVTGPEIGVGPFVLFSTGIGDAWLLDPDEQIAMSLVWRGVRREPAMSEDPMRLELGFDGHYELLGAFFHVESHNEAIGQKAIAGYPLDQLRPVLEEVKPFDLKFAELFGQFDAVDLTPEVIKQLVNQGWDEARLQQATQEGLRYSPSRNSLLLPTMSSDDEDFQDSEPNPP